VYYSGANVIWICKRIWQTNFPGPMYPYGYQVIQQSFLYKEKESEFDRPYETLSANKISKLLSDEEIISFRKDKNEFTKPCIIEEENIFSSSTNNEDRSLSVASKAFRHWLKSNQSNPLQKIEISQDETREANHQLLFNNFHPVPARLELTLLQGNEQIGKRKQELKSVNLIHKKIKVCEFYIDKISRRECSGLARKIKAKERAVSKKKEKEKMIENLFQSPGNVKIEKANADDEIIQVEVKQIIENLICFCEHAQTT
jgi:hypothetical protein